MKPRAADGLPPRPVMAFHVGVTGHRALPDADAATLATAAAAIFRDLRAAVLALHAADQRDAAPLYQPAAPLLRCISGLAEGADCLLAEAALAEGWTLVAALPFDRKDFARDFTPGPALVRFRTLLAQAACIVELDGDRSRGGEPYVGVGEIIVEQSDVLVAIWDGLPANGAGGTGDVAEAAAGRGLPVAVLAPTGPAEVAWRDAGAGDPAALVRAALTPPADPAGFPVAYFADAPRGTGVAAATMRAYEGLVAAGAPRPFAEIDAGGSAPPPVAAGTAALSAYFQPADRLATEYAARYRAAGLMRYGLIIPATLGSLVGSYGERWLQPAGNLFQFAVLVSLVGFSLRGGWSPVQRRFVAYRALAEYLRNARVLAPLGAVARLPGAATHLAQAADWTAWYGRAVLRGVGLSSLRFDAATTAEAAAFVRAEATNQVAFLLNRAARFDTVARRLRQIGVILSVCGIAFSAIRAALLLTDAADREMKAFNELALLLPAMAPVFLGLLSFNEYGTLATRYRAVAAELQAQVASLDRAAPQRQAVLRVARRITDVMLAESMDWRLLIKSREVSPY